MASTFSMRSLLRALPTTSTTTTTATIARAARTTTATTTTTTARARGPAPAAPRPSRARALCTTAPRAARMKKKERVDPALQRSMQRRADAALAVRTAARRRRAQQAARLDPRVAGLMRFLYAPTQTPAPLRMARNRRLRHWTVHRAWQLWRRRRAAARARELMQMQQCMARACEALRTLAGPGTRPVGWLFRKSMEKVGVWGMQAVPIEYARPMVETPGDKPWNHEWKRA